MRTKVEYKLTIYDMEGRSETYAFLASLGSLSCPGHTPSSALQGLAALVQIETWMAGRSWDGSRLRGAMTARGLDADAVASRTGFSSGHVVDALAGIMDSEPILRALVDG